jgi:hypothetical protein
MTGQTHDPIATLRAIAEPSTQTNEFLFTLYEIQNLPETPPTPSPTIKVRKR